MLPIRSRPFARHALTEPSASGSSPFVVAPQEHDRPERSAPAAATVGVPNDGELAWQLVAEVTELMNARQKAAVYLKLGCGDNYEAVVQMLEMVRRHQFQLSADVIARAHLWVNGYVGSDNEGAVRSLVQTSPVLAVRQRPRHA